MLDLVFAFIAGLSVAQTVLGTVAIAVLGVALQRRYLSSISDIPGPFSASFSLFWKLYKIFTKHTERATIDAHKKYGMPLFSYILSRIANISGKFVRISHNEVSISDPDAVREVLQTHMDKVCSLTPLSDSSNEFRETFTRYSACPTRAT